MIRNDDEAAAARQRAKVSRDRGRCTYCQRDPVPIIRAYDPAVYEGWACPDCILGGEASRFAPEHGAMRPMTFVAKGLKGEQPFARLLEVADRQKLNPEAARQELQRIRQQRGEAGPNRKQRRAEAAKKRRGRKG